MADEKLDRHELHAARSRRQGHRPREVRRGLPRRRHAVLQAAAQPDAARARHGASTPARRWRCRASRRSSPPTICPRRRAAKPALTNEPLFEGEPILAVAAVDEVTAADAIERIVVDLEPLPFVIDPLESLRPGGPNARLDGNVLGAAAAAGRRPRAHRQPAARR